MSVSRLSARTYRLLAAAFWRPRIAAVSLLLLEVAEHQHLAVERVHGVQDILEPGPHLGPHGGEAGRRQPAEQEVGKREAIGLGQRPGLERDLAPGLAHLGPEMLAVQRRKPLAGEVPEPEERRHPGVGEVLGLPLVDVEERLLEDVRGIDPPLEAPVQPQSDHPTQPVVVLAEELH
jgi:hypothetical protein